VSKNYDNIRVYADDATAVWLAPKGTVMPTTLEAPGAAFEEVGWLSEDGITEGRSVEVTKVKAFQGGKTVRSRPKSTERTLKFTALETKLQTLRAYLGGTVTTTVTGQAAAPALAAPVLSSPTTATTGGSLAAATYYYKATYTNAAGETVGSNEISQVTTGTASTVTFTIGAAPAGATGTKIYRSTATGAEVLLDTLATTPTTYTDNGSKTPGTATVPTSNTTAVADSRVATYSEPEAAALTEYACIVDKFDGTVQTRKCYTLIQVGERGDIVNNGDSGDFYEYNADIIGPVSVITNNPTLTAP
jgi:hypothetical protein